MRDELLALFPGLRKLPPNVFVVGGAVRDLHLGVHPADVDVGGSLRKPGKSARSSSRM